MRQGTYTGDHVDEIDHGLQDYADFQIEMIMRNALKTSSRPVRSVFSGSSTHLNLSLFAPMATSGRTGPDPPYRFTGSAQIPSLRPLAEGAGG